MTDTRSYPVIVERLRDEAARDDHRGAGLILRVAAAEIERLHDENERYSKRAQVASNRKERSRLIDRAAGMLDSATAIDVRAERCSNKSARAILVSAADDLRNMAVAERKIADGLALTSTSDVAQNAQDPKVILNEGNRRYSEHRRERRAFIEGVEWALSPSSTEDK